MAKGGEIVSARLEGARIRLRPVRPADAPVAFEQLFGRNEILRWLRWNGPASVGELEAYFARWTRPGAERADYLFAVEELAEERFVGTLGVRFGGQDGTGDLGYWLAEAVWGRGLGTEAIRLACAFCFHELDVPTLSAWVFVGNRASRRVLERNGFQLVRTAPNKREGGGPPRDEWFFVLLREEWLAREGSWRPASVRIERSPEEGPARGP